MKVGVVGGGLMGLSAAYELAKAGHSVILFEKEAVLGGLAVSIDFAGVRIEKYYHFVCLPDKTYINLLKELGLESKLHWRPTRMSYFYNGEMFQWGDPVSLLTFPHLSPLEKIRYGLNVIYCKLMSNWQKIEHISAVEWLQGWLGKHSYDIFWKVLLELKFWHYTDEVSAAWLWSRIRRVAASRKNLVQEYYGYVEGGTETVINKLSARIREKDGEIRLSSPVSAIKIDKGRVEAVIADRQEFQVEALISTIPLPELKNIDMNLPHEFRQKLERVKNIGVVCALIELQQPLTNNYWLNINDSRIKLVGVIEYTNLNDSDYLKGKSILYIPQYVSSADPLYAKSDQEILDECLAGLRIINPGLKVISARVFRNKYAQPIPEKNFSKLLPEIQTPIGNFLIADTSYYFPEDRSIDQSLLLGQKLARMV